MDLLNVRCFGFDYIDSKNKCFNNSIITIGEVITEDIINNIIDMQKKKGYTVYTVFEIVGGYTMEEVAKLCNSDIERAAQLVKPVYCNNDIMKKLKII